MTATTELEEVLADLVRGANALPLPAQRAAVLAGVAQASATLALVEQQRTANLLTVLAHEGDGLTLGVPRAAIVDQITTALDLPKGTTR